MSEDLVSKEKAILDKSLEDRRTLRGDNVAPGPHRLAGPKLKEYKSDVKKGTAFSKKVKGFSAEQLPGILSDLKTLNVSMFASECAQSLPQALAEGKMKMGDVGAFVTCWSALHQKYEKFSEDSLGNLKKGFSIAPILEEMEGKLDLTASAADVTKARVLIRAWCEMWLVGLIPSIAFVDAACAQILKQLEAKKENHLTTNALALVLLILRTVGPELDPEIISVPAVSTVKDAQEVIPEDQAAVTSMLTEVRAANAKTVGGYSDEKERTVIRRRISLIADKAGEFSLKLKKQVESQYKTLCEQTELRGEMAPEVKEKFAKVKSEGEKWICLTNQINSSIGRKEAEFVIPAIDLSSALQKSAVDESVVFQSGLQDFYSVKDIESVNRYDSDEERAFYENLIDIEELFGPSRGVLSQSTSTTTGGGSPASTTSQHDIDSTANTVTLDDVGASTDASDGAKSVLSQNEKAELNYEKAEELLSRLHQSGAKEYIDKWIVEFIEEIQRLFVNPESTTGVKYTQQQAHSYMSNCLKMLISELRFAPTNSSEMLPFLSRCIATFSKKFSDFGEMISSKLEGEVQHAVRDNEQQAYRRKMRGVKYICELIKFRVAPPIRAIRLMKLCLEDWQSAHNNEMLIALIEGVGPFFMRGGVTREKMEGILADLLKVRSRFGVREEYEALLDSAVLATKQANNPVVKRMPRGKPKTPLELYTSYILFSELTEDTFFQVRKKIRSLPWTMPGTNRRGGRDKKSGKENKPKEQDEQQPESGAKDMSQADLCCAIMRKSHKCSWDRMHLLSELIADVTDVHGWVGVNIVDSILESLRMDLEHPDNRTQQMRLQDLKLLGELFNFRVIEEEMLFFVMATLSLYHPRSLASPTPLGTPQVDGNINPTDYSRIRSTVTLLETAGPYLLDKKSMTPKTRSILRVLLNEFFLLCHTKQKPLPLDLDYKLAEVVKSVSKACNNRRGETDISFPSTFQAAKDQLQAALRALESQRSPEAAWLLDLLGSLKDTTGARIYPVAKKIAPVGLGSVEGKLAKDGPRSTPMESHREDDQDEEGSDDSDDSSDYSDSDSDSDTDDDSDNSSDYSDSEEEEEEEDIFSRGQFTKGGNWGQGRVKKGMSEEDREFAEMLLEAQKESSRQGAERGKIIQQKQGSIERTMEGKLPTRLQPYIDQANKQQKKVEREEKATPSAAEDDPTDKPVMRFTVLRRGQNNPDRVETHKLMVPTESQFAQRTAQNKSEEEKEKIEMARKIAELAQQQRDEEASDAVPGSMVEAGRGRGGRGRGRGGLPPPAAKPKAQTQSDFKMSWRLGGK